MHRVVRQVVRAMGMYPSQKELQAMLDGIEDGATLGETQTGATRQEGSM